MRTHPERPDLRMVRTACFCERCGSGYEEDQIVEGDMTSSTWRTACRCTRGQGRCELPNRDPSSPAPGRQPE